MLSFGPAFVISLVQRVTALSYCLDNALRTFLSHLADASNLCYSTPKRSVTMLHRNATIGVNSRVDFGKLKICGNNYRESFIKSLALFVNEHLSKSLVKIQALFCRRAGLLKAKFRFSSA